MRLKRTASVTAVLGFVSILAVFIAHLSLTDVYHGEGDLTLEWSVLRVCFVAIVAFQLAALLTLRRVINYPVPSRRPNRRLFGTIFLEFDQSTLKKEEVGYGQES